MDNLWNYTIMYTSITCRLSLVSFCKSVNLIGSLVFYNVLLAKYTLEND